MRILSPQVGLDPHLGGGRHDIEMLSALARAGHEVLVLIPRSQRSRARMPEGCEVKWTRGRWGRHPFTASIALFPAILKASRAFRPDVIRVHSPYTVGLATLAVSRIFRVPAVASFHHSFERFPGARWTERRLFPRFARVTTVSEFSRRQIEGIAPGIETRTSVVYNGVAGMFRPGSGGAVEWRAAQGLEVPLFVAVGALVPRKNYAWLVDVMASWAREGRPGTLVICGEGPERTDIEHRIRRSGLEGRVHLWGIVDDAALVSLLQAADALLHPSLMEGFGLAPVEALACGTPAVVSDRGSLPEIVDDGRTGFVRPLNAPAWLDALEAVKDPSRRAAMGVSAAREARERFSWDRAAREMTQVFDSAASKGTSRCR